MVDPPDNPDSLARLREALGRDFEVRREIGRGGAALVFLAHDLKHDRPVAVKILRPEIAAYMGAAQFLREIATAARLQHPHIVPIYGSGDVASMLYLVMPYVEGESLRERLDREQTLALADALRLTLEVAEALSFAHSRGVIHCDIKPENILLFRGHALVADFGIATHRAAAPITTSVDESSTDILTVGTPLYMAPEQMLGDEQIDERADLYALGTVLYELLTGHPPFTGSSSMAVLGAKITTSAPPPTGTREALPEHIVAALRRALESERQARFASVAEFAQALSATPSSPFPVRRSGATRVRAAAVLPFVNRGGQAHDEYLSDGITDALIHALSGVRGLRVVGRASAFAYKGRTDDVRSIGADLAVSEVLTGTVQRAGERLRITAELTDVETGFSRWSEQFDGTVTDLFTVQDEIAHAITESFRVHVRDDQERALAAPTGNFQAYESYLKGRFDWSQRTAPAMQRALDHMHAAVRLDPSFALAWSGLADCWITLGVYDVMPATMVMPKALEATAQALRHDPTSADALTARASIHALYEFAWDRAETDYIAALTLREQSPVTHQWYAMHLLAPRRRFVEARDQIARARELDPVSPSIAASAGILRLYAGEPEQAVRELELVTARHPSFGLAHLFIGRALTELQQFDAAVRALERAALLSNDSVESHSALACALARGGDVARAEAELATLGHRSESEYVSAVSLAEVNVALGRPVQATRLLERALRERATSLILLPLRPSFAALRDQTGFESLLRSMGV
jgi:eukaryotic-like serine/threonine-protein kinase